MKFKPLTRDEAKAQGYTIDDCAPGRPYAYKGPRFGSREGHGGFSILTNLEVQMKEHLETALEEAENLLLHFEDQIDARHRETHRLRLDEVGDFMEGLWKNR